jgi:hypothetical protein
MQEIGLALVNGELDGITVLKAFQCGLPLLNRFQ